MPYRFAAWETSPSEVLFTGMGWEQVGTQGREPRKRAAFEDALMQNRDYAEGAAQPCPNK